MNIELDTKLEKDTLDFLVTNGRATLYDLKSNNIGNDKAIKSVISKLKKRQLIAEKTKDIVDFTTYYPTSNGRNVYNNLKISKKSFYDTIKDTLSSMKSSTR